MSTTSTYSLRSNRWTDEAIIAALVAEFEATGKVPTSRTWQSATENHPASVTVTKRFGSWLAALEKAGLLDHYDVSQNIWDMESVIYALNRWAAEHGCYPKKSEWTTRGTYWPSDSVVRNIFGKWLTAVHAAKDASDIDYPLPKRGHTDGRKYVYGLWNRQTILTEICEHFACTGEWPLVTTWKGDKTKPQYHHIRKFWDSWDELLTDAGYRPTIKATRKARRTMPGHIQNLVFARDNHTCQNPHCECLDTRLTVDHIIPVKNGGTDDPENLQTLCGTCNSRKGIIAWDVFVAGEAKRIAA